MVYWNKRGTPEKLQARNPTKLFWGLIFWYFWAGRARHPGPPSQSRLVSLEFHNVGGWLTHGDLALNAGVDFLAVAEHRLIPARVRPVCVALPLLYLLLPLFSLSLSLIVDVLCGVCFLLRLVGFCTCSFFMVIRCWRWCWAARFDWSFIWCCFRWASCCCRWSALFIGSCGSRGRDEPTCEDGRWSPDWFRLSNKLQTKQHTIGGLTELI